MTRLPDFPSSFLSSSSMIALRIHVALFRHPPRRNQAVAVRHRRTAALAPGTRQSRAPLATPSIVSFQQDRSFYPRFKPQRGDTLDEYFLQRSNSLQVFCTSAPEKFEIKTIPRDAAARREVGQRPEGRTARKSGKKWRPRRGGLSKHRGERFRKRSQNVRTKESPREAKGRRRTGPITVTSLLWDVKTANVKESERVFLNAQTRVRARRR